MVDQAPQLTVISDGPLRGRTYAVRHGNQLLGRGADADVVVESLAVSRRHAYLSWNGRTAAIADAESTNGTTVNGEAIRQTRALRPGDVVRLGGLALRFDLPGTEAAGDTGAAGGPHFSNQFGGDNYGDVYQGGRDVNVQSWHEHRHAENDLDELFRGRGFGRLLMAIGVVVALAGFAGWMYLIFSSASIDSATDAHPLEGEAFGLPVAMILFGVAAVGGVLAAVGESMSRAARTRGRDSERIGSASLGR